MKRAVFERYRSIIHQESGIFLSEDKMALLVNRIRKRCMQLGVSGEEEYLEIIETDFGSGEITELIDAISTNVTAFYRESEHFELLTRKFREWSLARRPKIRIWSAACSSGEEPYTIAMCASEALSPGTTALQLLATDICTKVLARAREGKFQRKQAAQLPKQYVKKYFSTDSHDEDVLTIRPSVQDLVKFRQHNLSRFPYQLSGSIDFIFCRNVMIYFDNGLRQKIVGEFERLLSPGGYLCVGHSESLFGLKHRLQMVQPAVYMRVDE